MARRCAPRAHPYVWHRPAARGRPRSVRPAGAPPRYVPAAADGSGAGYLAGVPQMAFVLLITTDPTTTIMVVAGLTKVEVLPALVAVGGGYLLLRGLRVRYRRRHRGRPPRP